MVFPANIGPMITWTSPATRCGDPALTAPPSVEVNENEFLKDSMEQIGDEKANRTEFESKSEAQLKETEAMCVKI